MTPAPAPRLRIRRIACVLGPAAALMVLTAAPSLAINTDARRTGMGGVLLPGREMVATNPAWIGAELPHPSRSIPLPLGVVAGLAADTEGQNDFESAVTRLKAAYPFFEVELRPEPALTHDITIDVAENYLRVDLGQGSKAIPEGPLSTDYLSNSSWLSVSPGPLFIGLGTIIATEGEVALDDSLTGALRGGVPLEAGTAYDADGNVVGQVAAALEIGTSVGLGELSVGSDVPWALRAGLSVKGLMGLGYADTRIHADMVTGDPIFDETNPLEVTYLADYRTSEKVGWGAALDLGLAAVRGPWFAGVSVENLAGRIRWTTEHRQEELNADGDRINTTLGTGEKITSHLPASWVANGGYASDTWLWAGDVRLAQDTVTLHGGVERRWHMLAARGGLSWSSDRGVQGAVGGGLGAGGWSLDVSLRTHPYLYSEGRGLYLGASLGVPL